MTLKECACFGSGLKRFVRDVERIRATLSDERLRAESTAAGLSEMNADAAWLCDEHSQPAESHGAQDYRQHLLYRATDGDFSVVALVWKPGQRTPIHDHVASCVVGVYQGREEEISYRLYDDGHERFLVEVGRQVVTPGDAVSLVPPDENIHAVSNSGTGLAISIHIYAADIAKLGSSMNQHFTGYPLRNSAGRAALVPWRLEGPIRGQLVRR